MIICCFLSCLVLSCIRYLYIPQRVYANHDLSVFPVLRILFSVDQATLFYLNGIGDVPFCQIQAYWHRKKKILLGVRNPPTTINGTLSTVLYILRSLESEESVEETEGRP